jgi:hypothetical protein
VTQTDWKYYRHTDEGEIEDEGAGTQGCLKKKSEKREKWSTSGSASLQGPEGEPGWGIWDSEKSNLAN